MSPRVSDLFLRSQSDERLVNLARTGHVRAFGAIVERYGPELAALARRLRPDGRDEDVLQQAFLSAFVALQAGSEVKHLRGWLYQIVRNASTRERMAGSAPLDGALAAPESLEDVVAQRALAMDVLSELSRLPDRQRQAMIGSALNGAGRAEIAISMGLSEGAVRQLIHRARRTLRSAVTALTPWPLARWLTARSAGGASAASAAGGGAVSAGSGGAVSAAGGGAVSAAGGGAVSAAGGGAISSGGVVMKLGLVLATGTLATGVATVAVHPGREHRRDARAARTARIGTGASGANAGSLTTASPSSTAAGAAIGGTRARTAVEVRFVPGQSGAGAAASPGAAGPGGTRRHRSDGAGRGPAGSTAGQGGSRGGDGGGRSGGGAGRRDGSGGGDGSGRHGGGADQQNGGGGGQQSGGRDQQLSSGGDQKLGGGGDQQLTVGTSQGGADAQPTAFASRAQRDAQGSDHHLSDGGSATTRWRSGDGSQSGGSPTGGSQTGGSQTGSSQTGVSQSGG